MKRFRGRVDAQPNERERAGVGDRERKDRAGVENGREVVAAKTPKRRVAEPREHLRLDGDDDHRGGADARQDRRGARCLGEEQRPDDHRAEDRERRLVGHARDRDPRRDAGRRRARDPQRRHQDPGRQISPERGHAPRPQAGQARHVPAEPVQDQPPQRRVVELRRQQAEHRERGPGERELQLHVRELVGLAENRERDASREQRRDRHGQSAPDPGRHAGQLGVGEARWHVGARHGASVVIA
jgi:hypothetical protein